MKLTYHMDVMPKTVIFKKLADSLFKTNKKVAEFLKAEIQAVTPYKSGDLMRSVDYEKLTWHRFDMVARAPYAAYIELGTRGTPEHPITTWPAKTERGDTSNSTRPFMMPTILKNRAKIMALYQKEMNKVLK